MSQEIIKALAKLGLTKLTKEEERRALDIIRGIKKDDDDPFIETIEKEARIISHKRWGTDISMRHIDAVFLPKDNESVLDYVLDTERQLREEIKALWKHIDAK